jgi:phage baseplate assembly protein W
MIQNYYTLPLTCETIIGKKRQQKCGLGESIQQHIHLILRTHFKEYRYDPAFGNMVWEKDFETIRSVPKWKNELSEDFAIALKKYEKRLSQIRVATELDELKVVDPQTQKVSELRKRVTIRIDGIITQTNEYFKHTECIFFSPLSLT